jgi:hypothetical protein
VPPSPMTLNIPKNPIFPPRKNPALKSTLGQNFVPLPEIFPWPNQDAWSHCCLSLEPCFILSAILFLAWIVLFLNLFFYWLDVLSPYSTHFPWIFFKLCFFPSWIESLF